jgi:hypothetical protein
VVPLLLGRPHVHLVRDLTLGHGGPGENYEVLLGSIAAIEMQDGVTHKRNSEEGRGGVSISRTAKRETKGGGEGGREDVPGARYTEPDHLFDLAKALDDLALVHKGDPTVVMIRLSADGQRWSGGKGGSSGGRRWAE